MPGTGAKSPVTAGSAKWPFDRLIRTEEELKPRSPMDFIERHSPANRSWFEHGHSSLQRYTFALEFVAHRVLDVACGTGYGTYVLGNRGSHVTGGGGLELAQGGKHEAGKSGIPFGQVIVLGHLGPV